MYRKSLLKFYTGRTFQAAKPKPIPPEQINHIEQPWQKHARKLAERAKSHMHPLARREAREARKAAELAATVTERAA